jgi:hypothetical protein
VKLSWSIWLFNSLLQWALLAMVLWKDRWRQHAAFAFYIAFCACKTSLLIWIAVYLPHLYFPVNWGARLITVPLMIAVLVEVFAGVFRPYSTLPPGTLRWFKIALGILVVVTACSAIYYPGATPGNARNTIYLLNRSAAAIFCGAFAFTALVSSYFGIPWRTRTYGIGVGFLLFMSVDLFTSSLSAGYGEAAIAALVNVSMLSYTLGLVTWLIYFAIPDVDCNNPTLEQMRRMQRALDSAGRKVECSGKTK